MSKGLNGNYYKSVKPDVHLEVRSVENGYIVKVTKHGFSIVREPFEATEFICTDFEMLETRLKEFLLEN